MENIEASREKIGLQAERVSPLALRRTGEEIIISRWSVDKVGERGEGDITRVGRHFVMWLNDDFSAIVDMESDNVVLDSKEMMTC